MAISFCILSNEIEFCSLTFKFLRPIIQLKFIPFSEEMFQISLWKAFAVHQWETNFRSLLSVYLSIGFHRHPIYCVLMHLNLILNSLYLKWLEELVFKIEIFWLWLSLFEVFSMRLEYLARLLLLMAIRVV